MEELDSRDYLVIKSTGFFLRETVFAHDVVKELATAGIFHNQEDACLCLNDLVQFNYVTMANTLKNLDLANHAFNVCLVSNTLFLEDFNCHKLTTRQVLAELHIAESALAQVFKKTVLVSNHLRSIHALHGLHLTIRLRTLVILSET